MLVALIILSYLKENTGAINKIMLDYSCNQSLSYKKSFASTKLPNKIKLHINLYIIGCPFSMYKIIIMYTEILSYSKATNICLMENNPDVKTAFISSLLHAIFACNRLLFLKIFSNLVHFLPNFQIFALFHIFPLFSEKPHTCPYFLELALDNLLKFKNIYLLFNNLKSARLFRFLHHQALLIYK